MLSEGYPKALIQLRCSKALPGQVGLFAVRNLKKGTIIGLAERFGERFYAWSEYAKLDKQTRKMIDTYCASSEDGFWAPDDVNYIPLAFHMNHCCSGNVGFNTQGDFITIRYIRAGNELFFDYGLLLSNPKFKLKCKCGVPECRKIITGSDWKNPNFRQKYLHIMDPDLRRLILDNGS